MICTACNREFKNKQSLGAHNRWCQPKQKEQIKACKQCKKVSTEFDNFALHVRWCGRRVIQQNQEGNYIRICYCGTQFFTQSRFKKNCGTCKRLHTEETREKLRAIRKKWLADNPNRHPWKSKEKFNSIPCEVFKKRLLLNGINFEQEIQPVPGRYFSLDIAFPEKRIGIEINGNQHYNADRTLKKYYQDRHDLIVAQGWQLLELHYSIAFQEEKLAEIIEVLKKCINKIEFNYEFYISKNGTP